MMSDISDAEKCAVMRGLSAKQPILEGEECERFEYVLRQLAREGFVRATLQFTLTQAGADWFEQQPETTQFSRDYPGG
jgi:hypothetical protein